VISSISGDRTCQQHAYFIKTFSGLTVITKVHVCNGVIRNHCPLECQHVLSTRDLDAAGNDDDDAAADDDEEDGW
jgi:hypothetical protein